MAFSGPIFVLKPFDHCIKTLGPCSIHKKPTKSSSRHLGETFVLFGCTLYATAGRYSSLPLWIGLLLPILNIGIQMEQDIIDLFQCELLGIVTALRGGKLAICPCFCFLVLWMSRFFHDP